MTITERNNHGIIHCVQPNSCDGLTINTNSNYTRLIMYEHSESVTLNNGIGYISDLDNIICNNDRYFQYNTWTMAETEQTISASIYDEYTSDKLPCEDVHVFCNQSSCDITYIKTLTIRLIKQLAKIVQV